MVNCNIHQQNKLSNMCYRTLSYINVNIYFMHQDLDLELTDYHDESLFGTKTGALHLIMKLKVGVSNSKVEPMKLDQ